jgi:hypothetical protein
LQRQDELNEKRDQWDRKILGAFLLGFGFAWVVLVVHAVIFSVLLP